MKMNIIKAICLIIVIVGSDCGGAAFKASFRAANNIGLKKEVGPSEAKPEAIQSPDDLPEIPVYFQGWVKYFRYADVGERPKMFFKNSEFKVPPNHEMDEFGVKDIPDEKHFFLVIYYNQANFLTSRKNTFTQVTDSLNTDLISVIPEDDHYKGGIKDFGTFSEGSCFQTVTIVPETSYKMSSEHPEPQGAKVNWFICTDKEEDKNKIMNLLIKIKLKKQHQVGVYMSTTSDVGQGAQTEAQKMTDFLGGDSASLNKNSGPLDGHWVVLQKWSECTLGCGGGKSYLHLMCIPPKHGGKECVGEAIREKDCNTQPCPKIVEHENLTTTPEQTIEKVIVKVMPISTRPQRYDKCYLKDGDAMMTTMDQKTKLEIKIPIRLVMNNKSVSAFQDDTLQTNLSTFVLSKTNFARKTNDKQCFILSGVTEKKEFCQLDYDRGNFVEEWDYDFHLFKNQCKIKRETIEEEKLLAKEYDIKLKQLKIEMIEKKSQKVKENVQVAESTNLSKKINEAQSMTMKAIEKELKLEEMLESEEKDREKKEIEELELQIESEKKKNECISKSVQEKKIEDQMNISKSEADTTIEQIKNEAKERIKVKRDSMKRKISEMRKRSERKKQELKAQILTIRVATAEKMKKITRTGNSANCFNIENHKNEKEKKIEEIQKYCTLHLNDIMVIDRCQDETEFCSICCENEFGDLHEPERRECYSKQCESSAEA